MSVSPMKLKEIISSARNKTYTKKIVAISALAVVICCLGFLITSNFNVPIVFETILAILTILGLLSSIGAFVKWGDKCSLEQFALKNKIPDMTVGDFKKFYKTYGNDNLSDKKTDEKILMEQIMIDIALNFINQGEFIEPFKDLIGKGVKYKTSNVYAFIAMAVYPSLDDRVNFYILDTFFSASFLDDVLLESIKFKENCVNIHVLG